MIYFLPKDKTLLHNKTEKLFFSRAMEYGYVPMPQNSHNSIWTKRLALAAKKALLGRGILKISREYSREAGIATEYVPAQEIEMEYVTMSGPREPKYNDQSRQLEICKQYTLAKNADIKFECDGNKHIQQLKIEALRDGHAQTSQSDLCGRVFSLHNSVKKETRAYFKHGRKPTGEVDIRASHPTMIANFACDPKMLADCLAGNFYEQFKHHDEEEYKGLVMQHFYMSNPTYLTPLGKQFRDTYPRAHRFVMENRGKELAHTLMQVEAKIILEICNQYSGISVHDAVLAPANLLRQVDKSLKNAFRLEGIDIATKITKPVPELNAKNQETLRNWIRANVKGPRAITTRDLPCGQRHAAGWLRYAEREGWLTKQY